MSSRKERITKINPMEGEVSRKRQIVDLSRYRVKDYNPGSFLKRCLWYVTCAGVFNSKIPFSSSIKVKLLRAFGGIVGENVIIRPLVRIKYPWFLRIGNNTWLGENVWIDNVGIVDIGDNVVISQGVFIETGNHDYRSPTFDLRIESVTIEEGVWLCAKSIICGSVICRSHSVLSAGAVALQNLEAYGVYKGNPSKFIRERKIS